MKNIIYIFISILVITCWNSCDEGFLDTVATDSYNEANWWKTENQAISSLNGCYAILRNSQIYGIQAFREENITPNSYSFGGDSPLDIGAHNSGNVNRFQAKWDAYYGGIGRVNDLFANIDKVDMELNLLQRIKGEASFLRALFYYNLVNYYGGVPLILDSPNFSEQGNLPRNTRQEVVEQVISDLDFAISNLPTSYTGSDIGRATKGAALAFKTRVFLYESQWVNAAITAQSIIDMNEYSLFPNYRGLFMLENEGNDEVIFDVQYLVPEYPTTWDIIIELQINVAPTLDLVNSYHMIDGESIQKSSLFNSDQPYENRDPRMHQTLVIPGYKYRGKIVPEEKYFSTGYGFKKYTTYKDDVSQPNINDSEINYIVLRYADVLLMYAEAQNEASGPDPSVYEAINMIRNRAGMPDVPSGMNKEQMRDIIRHERRVELAGEGLYYHDIRRWRIAEDVMNAEVLNSRGEVIQERSFNPQRDYLWPIHENIIQENPNIKQNPGY